MSANEPPPDIGLSWRMRQHEARLLADSLRHSRVTLLFAGAGTARQELLSEGVLPLLGRREADASLDGVSESRVVAPFIDRRDVPTAEAPLGGRVERTVYFSNWGGEPLAALCDAVRAAVPEQATAGRDARCLVDLLEPACRQLDARVLIILDSFEALWTSGADSAAIDRFISGFAEAVNRQRLGVNFLVAIDDRWEGRLDAVRRQIPEFDDSTVRLLGFERSTVPASPRAPGSRALLMPLSGTPTAIGDQSPPLPTLSDTLPPADRLPTASPAVKAPAARVRRPRLPKVPLPPAVPIKADGVYAFIESTLSQTSDASEPWHDGETQRPSAPATGAGGPRPAKPRSTARGGRSGRPGPAAALRRGDIAPPHGQVPTDADPPSPIDDWLDAAIAWCRRMLRMR